MIQHKKLIVGAIALAVLLTLITLFFFIHHQSDLTVEAPAPPREVTPVTLPPPTPSTIAARVALPMHEVKQLTEKAIRDYLHEPIKRKDGAIEYAIKLDPSTLKMTVTANGTVSASLPFQFTGWVRVSKKIFGQVIQKREDIKGTATASLTLTPTLNADWQITAKTTSDIFIQKAEIKIQGINISVRRILNTLVEDKVLPKVEHLIVQYITEVDLKTRVAGLWAKLYEPIVIKQTPPIALIVEPLEILAEKLSSNQETLFFSFGIKTYIHANIGEGPKKTGAFTEPRAELPNIQFVDSLESGYHIIAPIDVTYTAIEKFVKPHVEKKHKLKGIDTLVENLTIYGSGTRLAAGIGFKMPALAANGQLYMIGTPIYDPTTTALSVNGFDYDLTTQNLLLDMAENIGEGIFPNLRTALEEKLVFPLETQINALHKKLADGIAERQIGPYVLLHGTVDAIIPETLYLTQEGVHLLVRSHGNLTCEINLNPSSTP